MQTENPSSSITASFAAPVGPPNQLRQEAGLFQVVAYGVGNIVGAGIYVLIGDAAELAGNEVWLAFLVGATIAIMSGLSYAELSSMYPSAASEYVYLGRAYGNRLLSFMTEWVMLITEIVAAAAVSLGFAGYLASIIPVPESLVAVSLLTVLTLVSIGGAKGSFRLNTILSLVAIAGLILVIVAGMGRFGSVTYTDSPAGLPGVLGAAVLVFFAFIGFDNMSNIAEETKNPEKTIPRGLLIAVSITTLLYVFVGLAAVSLTPWQQLSTSEAPLALAASSALGSSAYNVLAIVALLTTLNTVLVLLIVSSRIMYGMGREGALPRRLGTLNTRTSTPILASVAVVAVALCFLPLGKVAIVARITSFGSLLTFALVNLAMLHLRRVAPHLRRPFKAPLRVGWISLTGLLGLVSCLALLTQFDALSTVLGLALPLSGLIVYLLIRTDVTSASAPLHQPHE